MPRKSSLKVKDYREELKVKGLLSRRNLIIIINPTVLLLLLKDI